MKTPFDQIHSALENDIPPYLLDFLPKKWEKIGNVCIIKLHKKLTAYQQKIGKIYAEVLKCKSVLNDIGGITGRFREPKVRILFGSKVTETCHVENGIKYKLDPQKIMFSSGNMNERLRMSCISNSHETVVDLFAGIGYFSLPLAVHSKPKKVYSCEINPISYQYLCDNIVLNHVTSIVEPLLGNNKQTAPHNIAHRIIMGYFSNGYEYIPTAVSCLRNKSGIIHFHDIVLVEDIPLKSFTKIQKILKKIHRKAVLLQYHTIKSYAPGVNHIVLDINVGET